MNETWNRQLEPFITPCLVLFDFNQVFVKSLKIFAQTKVGKDLKQKNRFGSS